MEDAKKNHVSICKTSYSRENYRHYKCSNMKPEKSRLKKFKNTFL